MIVEYMQPLSLALAVSAAASTLKENSPAAGFSNPKFQHILAYSASASFAMAKWKAPRDSVRRVGLVRYPQGLANSSGAYQRWESLCCGNQKCENWGCFCLWCLAPEGYGETESTTRFSSSSRPRTLFPRTNCSGGIWAGGITPLGDSEMRKSGTFLHVEPEPGVL